MKLTEQYDGHVLALLEDPEDWNKEKLIAVLSRSSNNSRMEYCEDQTHMRALQRPQSCCRNQTKPVLFETDTVVLEGAHVAHGQLFALQILEISLWTGALSLRNTKTSLFLLSSESARTAIATA